MRFIDIIDAGKNPLGPIVYAMARAGREVVAEIYKITGQRGESFQAFSQAMGELLVDLLERLKEEISLPRGTAGHGERKERVTVVFGRIEDEIVGFGVRRGIPQEKLRSEPLARSRLQLEALVVLIGDQIEQHPLLFERLLVEAILVLVDALGPRANLIYLLLGLCGIKLNVQTAPELGLFMFGTRKGHHAGLGRALGAACFVGLIAPTPVASIPSPPFGGNALADFASRLHAQVHAHAIKQWSAVQQVQTYLTPQSGAVETNDEDTNIDPDNFWRRATELGERAQRYAEHLANEAVKDIPEVANQFRNIKDTVASVITITSEFKDEMSSNAEVHQENLEDFSEGLSRILDELFERLKDEFPPPDHAPSHEERQEKVSIVFSRVEEAIVHFAGERGMSEERVREFMDRIRPHIEDLIVTIGDLVEQHPVLLETLLIAGTFMLIPEGWFLRPLLRLFGFGPEGPIKGSVAAWSQRVFYGARVPTGSWFSHLQRAGMIAWEPIKRGWWAIIGGIIAGVAGLLDCLRR
ncbi:hypothetical protein WOLCODRAFT_166848 [Wolfiporia cocos MD-104 SS10]|uniref:Uncharacterized protein n=1 Tax=Wolfiporia cocos (strain MD-104) TaxID=742152 RepID=A0A2H3JC70_WOLCO|nr:hypothetical protein WOLCODRAFT_166848 [Wolfiporia cocos MD-104 SS10]